jgi:geranylgeranyl pyrophosphate synthase
MERLDTVAVAVEMIHAYSLVHDDLPAMDDDDLRRGRPTCHLAFDEATAILAGDALQTEAFAQLAHLNHPDASRPARMVATLADAAGARGMAGGQAMDLALTGQDSEIEKLEKLHSLKTAALIRGALTLGAMTADTADETLITTLDRVGLAIGLAFQIQDDVLDVTGDTRTLGKSKGADAAKDKPTFASVLGADEATERYRALYAEATEALETFGEKARGLKELIVQMGDRQH